jgi:hypothetical protein
MKREEIIIRTLIMLAGLGVIIYFSTRGASSSTNRQSIKDVPTKLNNVEHVQEYIYPSGDKGTLPYDWKTGEKGIELNQNKDG